MLIVQLTETAFHFLLRKLLEEVLKNLQSLEPRMGHECCRASVSDANETTDATDEMDDLRERFGVRRCLRRFGISDGAISHEEHEGHQGRAEDLESGNQEGRNNR